MVSGVGAEVEVRIAKLINICDIGKPINPKICVSQISGAAMMQLGFTMFEKMQFDGGQVTNASLADYKVPGIHDLPDVMENEAIEARPIRRTPRRRQGRRRGRDVLRVARHRQRHRRRRRRATDGIAAQPGIRAAGVARQGEPPHRRRMMGGESIFAVIPGRASSREPGIQRAVQAARPFGFRVPACGRPRNDAVLNLRRRTRA
jgi:Molybdopterin-binding domain of aldehyde dehydrogenase